MCGVASPGHARSCGTFEAHGTIGKTTPGASNNNPPLAHQARSRPNRTSACCCPATSSSTSANGQTHIAAIDAERMLSIVDNDELAPVAADVKGQLGTVVERAAAG
jgi:hypothetical protein